MVARLFRMGYAQDKALQRLGAATLLNWRQLPAHIQDQIVTQALAMSNDDEQVHGEIDRMLGKSPT
jgi:hypothetical protein